MDKILMLGIAGVGMRRLAEIFVSLDFEVVGFDVKEDKNTDHLKQIGVVVNPKDFELDKSFSKIVFTSAIPKDDPILTKAQMLNIPVQRRGEALAEISKSFKSVVIAGTHGKTSTTALISEILAKPYKVNAYSGGEHRMNEGFYRDADYFVIESDESDKTFLLFFPYAAIVTNIDRDHLNSYDWNFEHLKDSFDEFMKKSKLLFIAKDDKPAFEVSKNLSKKPFYYSLYDNTADAYATDPLFEKDGVSFGAHVLGETLPLMKLHAYGEKMLSNAIGAILTSKILGVNNNEIEEAIFNFSMPKRRTEFKTNINGIYVFDDHADHPTEVEATLSSLRMHFPDERIIAIFQPHRYTRVYSLQEEIAKPFYLADIVIVLPIFSAFEEPINGVTDEKVFNWIKSLNPKKDVYFVENFDILATLVSTIAKKDDIVVTLGPGNVNFAIDKIVLKLKEKA